MIKINKKTEYALIALKHMALKPMGDLSSAREISDKYNTPFDTTAKIMQALANANILISNQGVKGGYALSKDLREVNFIEVTQIIEKKSFDFSCSGPSGVCDLFEVCNIKSPLQSISFKLKEFFENISLYELLHLDKELPFKGQETLKQRSEMEQV